MAAFDYQVVSVVFELESQVVTHNPQIDDQIVSYSFIYTINHCINRFLPFFGRFDNPAGFDPLSILFLPVQMRVINLSPDIAGKRSRRELHTRINL